MRRTALALILSTCLTGAAGAQLASPLNSRPDATAKVDTIPAARDIPYPGTIQLTVDASDNALDFFKKRGYVAQQRNTVTVQGEWLANTTMQKTLDSGGAKP